LKLLKNNEISLKKWDELLVLSPYASAFQTYSFHKIFSSVSGLESEVFAVEVSQEIKVLCVVTFQKEPGFRSFFSRRAIIYGGPVLIYEDESALTYLLTVITKEYKNKAIYTEIRSLHNYDHLNKVFERNGWKNIPYQNFRIDCSDKDRLYQKLSNNRKRQINKAFNSGVIIKEAKDVFEIYGFYSVLKILYDKKIKKPLLPQDFFIDFYKANLGIILLVIYKEKIIGGIMCPRLENRCLYEFYICGLDKEYKAQYPSVIATWAAILYANENNIAVFDFMGAGRKGENYGVRDFKARFGGEPTKSMRYLKINNFLLYKTGQLALNQLKVLRKK
jgi:serine/alanine adding enzyme